MTTQILRTIDRWRFETPLSVALGASAGFVALSAPAQLFSQVPVAGDMGTAGRAIVAAVLAAVAGGAGYVAMRKPVKAAPAPTDPLADIPEEDRPSGMPAERFARFRRADAHPDAPPRPPIIASRDLGEPFMEVGTPAVEAEVPADDQWWPETSIPDADYVEVPEEAAAKAVEAAEPVAAGPETVEVHAEEPKLAWPVEAAPAEQPSGKASISAMMERLSSGLERRASMPPRDPTPALRDALAELNRLAERRD
ncbi:hypothetical protein HZF05_01980 [Sphingomonas sp. CGMCC 1.13654]|uniref:Uncharacterized protein n=1 Tax=Sphingomonas chungangi TaxID=2683589 RepID=A0A838L3R9_9SPHN|nr:hypothetical protein [Sphingomonas chungangi]MBA2932856.1 hypothetical protein [Sphingomonas chungangi]MVW56477.1 hypothetical protein [Sphingomonas chungangi]